MAEHGQIGINFQSVLLFQVCSYSWIQFGNTQARIGLYRTISIGYDTLCALRSDQI